MVIEVQLENGGSHGQVGVSFTEKKAAAPWGVGTFASHSQPLPCTAGLSLHLQFPTAHGQRHRESVSSLCPTCPCPPTSLQPLLRYFPCLASSAATSKSWSIFIRNLPKGVLKYHSLGAEGLVHDLEPLMLPFLSSLGVSHPSVPCASHSSSQLQPSHLCPSLRTLLPWGLGKSVRTAQRGWSLHRKQMRKPHSSCIPKLSPSRLPPPLHTQVPA